MRKFSRRLALGLFLCLTMAVSAWAADRQIPVVTGEHWVKSSPQEREAFLLGAGTIIELDQEVQGTPPAPNSTINVWAKGLSPYTFQQMAAAINKWYADHPDKLSRPVVEVMWYELARPNCQDPVEPSASIKAKLKAKAGQ